jgi:hypothetical protein
MVYNIFNLEGIKSLIFNHCDYYVTRQIFLFSKISKPVLGLLLVFYPNERGAVLSRQK